MDVAMSDTILGLLMALVVLVTAVIRQMLIPYVKAKTTREQRELAYGIVVSAVGMAEQAGLVSGLDSEEKRLRALGWIMKRFHQLDIEVDPDEVDGWIENAVLHLEDSFSTIVDIRELTDDPVDDQPDTKTR